MSSSQRSTGSKKDNLVKRFGLAGEGFEYHHIVEQNKANAAQLTPEKIHLTDSIVRMPTTIHREINREYSSKTVQGGPVLRFYLREKSFDDQFRRGVEALNRFGLKS